MTRRDALLAVALTPAAQGSPYYPAQPATTWITVDLSKLEQLTIRLPQGMVTYSSKELWEALKK
jgi:hypothetical protein